MRLRRIALVVATLASALAGSAGAVPDERAVADRSPNIRELGFFPTSLHLKDAVFRGDLLIAARYDMRGAYAEVENDGFHLFMVTEQAKDGLEIFRVSEGAPHLRHLSSLDCRQMTDHASISVWRRWVFVSVVADGRAGEAYLHEGCESPRSDGLLVLDIADPRRPEVATFIESTCVNATHTLLPHRGELYIYGGGHTNSIRTDGDCNSGAPGPTFDMEVMRFTPGDPPRAEIVSTPRFARTIGCHDITVLPSKARAACAQSTLGTTMLDISDPANPVELGYVTEPAPATVPSLLSWDGTVLIDNRAVGYASNSYESIHPATVRPPACTGADGSATVGLALHDVSDPSAAKAVGAFGLPRVAPAPCYHQSGNVVPMRDPSRRIAVTSWRKGGMSVIDFTDPASPREIGHWILPGTQVEAAYWYNGRIYLVEQGGTGTEETLTDVFVEPERLSGTPGIRVLQMDGLGAAQTRFFRDGYSNRSQVADFVRPRP